MTARLCIALVLLSTLAAASPTVEHLGQPCRAKNIRSGRIVVDRADGRERLVLGNVNEGSCGELLFVDFERNTATVHKAPAGGQVLEPLEVAGDLLVCVTCHDANFLVFDLKRMEFASATPFAEQEYFWEAAIGGDGRVYSGSYNGGKLAAFDPKTCKTEDFGNPAPPNLYCRQISALPDGRLLCHFIAEKNTQLIFDTTTRKFEPVPDQLKGVATGVTWGGCFLAGDKAFEGEDLHLADPPFPAPPAEKGKWSVNVDATSPDCLVLQQGKAIYTCGKGDKQLTLIAEVDLRGGVLMGADRKGRLLGVRGQDYFVLRPGDKALDLKPIPGETSPRPTWFLRVDDRDRIWGGPQIGQTLFYTDTHSGKTVNTPAISDTLGEVYDVAFLNGKVYAAAYIGGEIIEYDPAQPWDQLNNKNPRLVDKFYGRGYVRPISGLRLGPDGKLYCGWMAHYGAYGGAVSITDPVTGESELIKSPLGAQTVSGIAVDSKSIYIGTWLGANGLPNKKGEWGRFGIIDIATKEVVFRHEFYEASGVRVLGCDEKSGRVLIAIADKPRLFDTAKREFLDVLPDDTPTVASKSNDVVRDGCVYYGSGTSIIKLDIRSAKWSKVVDTGKEISRVALGRDGTIYFSSGVDVYAVRD